MNEQRKQKEIRISEKLEELLPLTQESGKLKTNLIKAMLELSDEFEVEADRRGYERALLDVEQKWEAMSHSERSFTNPVNSLRRGGE